MSAIRAALERILGCLQVQSPQMVQSLQPGLTSTEIAAIADLPFQLPTEVVELYQWRNGSSYEPRCCELLPSYCFLSLDEAINNYKLTIDIVSSIEENWQEYFNPSWLPLFSEDGNFYVVACNSDPSKPAPILYYSNEYLDSGQESEFDSLTDMLLAVAECWEQGAYYADSYGYPEWDEAKEIQIHLKYHPQQTKAIAALLDNQKSQLSQEELGSAYYNLAHSHHPRAADVILRDLPDPNLVNSNFDYQLIRLLGELNDPRALEYVLTLLQNGNVYARKEAILSLQSLIHYFPNNQRIFELLLQIVQDVNARYSGWVDRDIVLEYVLTLLQNGNAYTRNKAILRLQSLIHYFSNNQRICKLLLQTVQDVNAGYSVWVDLYIVVDLLGEFSDSRVVNPLIELYHNSNNDDHYDIETRHSILKTLGKLKDSRAEEFLLQIQQNE